MRNRVTIVFRCAALAFLIAASLSLSSRAQAQSDRPLFNIKEFGLEFFGFDEDADACGLFEGALKAGALVTGKRLPFRIINTVEQHALVSFMVDTFKASDRCITHIYLQAHYSLIARLPWTREDDLARIELWSTASFVVTSHNETAHLMAVVDTLRQQLESMADDWREQNVTRL